MSSGPPGWAASHDGWPHHSSWHELLLVPSRDNWRFRPIICYGGHERRLDLLVGLLLEGFPSPRWITLLLGLVMVAWSFGGPITKLMNRLFSKYIFNIPSPFWIENSTQQLDGDGANWARNRVLVPAISSFIDFWRFFHRLLFDPKGLRPTSQMKRVIVYKVEVRKNGRIYQSTINIVRCRKRDAYLP